MEKIQELTEKLLHEGVEKGQEEAQRIIEEAKKEAQKIVDAAKEQAKVIEAQGKKQAADLETNTKNELKLYTAQALNALKSEVANVVTNTVVSDAVNEMTQDKKFLQKFTVALASKWVENEPITIATQDAADLKAYFEKEAKKLLDKGVKITKVNGTDAIFTIAPEDGSYKVNFGKEEFENYFKAFLRPQLVEMLF